MAGSIDQLARFLPIIRYEMVCINRVIIHRLTDLRANLDVDQRFDSNRMTSPKSSLKFSIIHTKIGECMSVMVCIHVCESVNMCVYIHLPMRIFWFRCRRRLVLAKSSDRAPSSPQSSSSSLPSPPPHHLSFISANASKYLNSSRTI